MCFVVASVFDIVRIVRNAFQTAVAATSFGALRRGILTCMVALVCGTCGHSSSTPSPTDVDVAGRVTDFPTGAGVPAIGVTIGGQRTTTDGAGQYTVRLPIGDYVVVVDREPSPLAMMVRGSWTHGDLLVNGGMCGCRYGGVVDRQTGKPIAGATVSVGTSVTTDADGWYRIDGGCGSCGSCNTAVATFSANGYKTITVGLGRGFRDVQRLDVSLER